MHVEFTPETMSFRITLSELITMKQAAQVVWATSTQEGLVHEAYIAIVPKCVDDFIIADGWDFYAKKGGVWLCPDFDEMTPQQLIDHADDMYMLVVPRRERKEIA